MAGFTENALARKLQELNSSQQSIQTLSLWLIHHRKHHSAVVKTWFKEFMKGKVPISHWKLLCITSNLHLILIYPLLQKQGTSTTLALLYLHFETVNFIVTCLNNYTTKFTTLHSLVNTDWARTQCAF